MVSINLAWIAAGLINQILNIKPARGGRIQQILNIEPVRAIVPLVWALNETHSDYLKYDAVLELLKLVPQYSLRIWDADVHGTLVNIIAEDGHLKSGEATKRLFDRLQKAAELLLGRLCETPGSSFAWIRPILEGDSSHIIVALKILRHITPAAFAPFANNTVSLLKHRDPRVCEEALSLFKALAEVLQDAEFDTRLIVVRQGAIIPPLVKMLAEGTDKVKLVAAHVLISLSCDYDDETNLAIAQANAIPHLVAMLGEGTDGVKEAATTALYNISKNETYFYGEFDHDNIAAIVDADAIQPLVIMLRVGTDRIKDWAAKLIGNILSNTAYKVDVVREGAIPHLVLMLSVGETASSACTALLGLSTDNDENKVAIAREGAIPYLVQILSSEEEHFDASRAAEVLGELATNTVTRAEVVREGAIRPLVNMLTDGFGNESIFAIKALCNLMRDNENKVAIIEAGAITHLDAKLSYMYISADVIDAAHEALRILNAPG